MLAWLIEERPLRKTVETGDVADAFAAPQDTNSLRVITRSLSRSVGRERTERFIDSVIERAGVPFDRAEAWIVARSVDGVVPPDAFEAQHEQDRLRLAEAAVHLEERGFLAGGTDPEESPRLTAVGLEMFAELNAARRARLAEIVADWEPESPEVDAMIAALAGELGHEQPVPAGP